MADVGISDAKTANVTLIPKEIEKTRLFSESPREEKGCSRARAHGSSNPFLSLTVLAV